MSANLEVASPGRTDTRRQTVYGLVALVLSVMFVHSVYTLVIRPHAEEILAARAATATTAPGARQTSLRSMWIILKDGEQETCIILAVWSLCLLGMRAADVIKNRRLLALRFVDLQKDFVILPEDTRAYTRHTASMAPDEQDRLLPRALNIALARFAVTRSVHEAAEAAKGECETEAASLDSDLSMLRYTVWAIPAVGFVGTVRGIGNALQDAQKALGGDISGVTLGLGITFNATLVALTSCILVMFLLHQLQQAQDRLVLDTKSFVDRNLIARLRVS